MMLMDMTGQRGRAIKAEGNTPLLLADPSKALVVETGRAGIFLVDVVNGRPDGPRRFLFNAGKDSLVFGADPAADGLSMGILLVGERGTSVREIDVSLLREISSAGKTGDEVNSKVFAWAEELMAAVGKEMNPPAQDLALNPGVNRFDAGSVYAARSPMWIRQKQGASLVKGRSDWPAVVEGAVMPVTGSVWFTADSEVEIEDCTARVEPGGKEFRDFLGKYHRLIFSIIRLEISAAINAEKARVALKKEEKLRVFSSALGELGSVMAAEGEIPVGFNREYPLLEAMQIIGRYAGFKIKAPKQKEDRGDWSESARVIARASALRIRDVVLEGEWWHSDCGSLLGFLGEDESPVAIINVSPGKYEIHDPSTGTVVPLTKKTAAQLNECAYMLYRPFPTEKLGGMDLLKFGLHGCAHDVRMIIAMGILAAVLALLVPVVTGVVFDSIIPGAARNQMLQIAFVLFTAAVATALFDAAKGIAIVRTESRLDASLQAAVWDRLLSLPVPFFRKFSAGDLAVRSMGINQMRMILSGTTVTAMLALVFSLFSLALLFYYHKKLALVAVAVSAVGTAVTLAFGCRVVIKQRIALQLAGANSGKLFELVRGIPKLRVSGTEDRAFAEWAKGFSGQKRADYQAGNITGGMVTFNNAFPVVCSMILFTWFFTKIMGSDKGSMTTGHFIAFVSAFAQFQVALTQMTLAFTQALSVVPIFERLRPIIETAPETDETKAPPGELRGRIEVNGVNFSYSEDGPQILKDVSMQVNPGEFIAIVGESGSGKSTLLRLLLGFDTPSSGSIYYDNHDISVTDITGIRRQLGVVLQNGKILQGDVFRNIAGASNLTEEEAWEAARMVGLDEDINDMPMGMHTVLQTGGGTLSGGQRQRLLIARAIARKPRYLYFDEATSALDNRTQAIVSRSLEQLHVTRIVIAHRLSTIINADRIYVLSKGQMVQSGTYEELMKQEGLFAELAKRQIA